MAEFIAWCGFAGAWLLVAGPVHQASVELQEEHELQREHIRAANELADRPPPVSAWWWFLPPVKYLLERRRSRAYRESMRAGLAPEDLAGIAHYLDKARGWLMVGAGALCIAVKETWELREAYEWPVAVFAVLTVAAFAGCVGYTILGARRRHDFTGGDADGDR